MFVNRLYKVLPVLVFFSFLANYDTLLQKFLTAKKAVLFDNIVQDIAPENACAVDNWNNVKKYAFRCCLVRAVDEVPYEERDSEAIIQECKQQIPEAHVLLKELKKDENIGHLSDADFVNELYDRSIIIKTVNGSFTNRFSESGVKQFLVAAYKQHKILGSAFTKENCLSVKDLGKAGGGSPMTVQLFTVKSTCGGITREFVVKEGKNKELFGLSLAAHYQPLKPYVAPNMVAGFPIINLPIAYLHYKSADNQDHYVSIMPKAPGIQFETFITQYLSSPTDENKKILQKAYATLGKTLANFHKTFMKNTKTGQADVSSLLGRTLSHGDLHPHNFFYDVSTDTIHWIDNETISRSVVQHEGNADILLALFVPFEKQRPLSPSNLSFDQQKMFIKIFFTPFFKAYLDAWGGNRKQHADELKHLIYNNRALSTGLTDDYNAIIDELAQGNK